MPFLGRGALFSVVVILLLWRRADGESVVPTHPRFSTIHYDNASAVCRHGEQYRQLNWFMGVETLNSNATTASPSEEALLVVDRLSFNPDELKNLGHYFYHSPFGLAVYLALCVPQHVVLRCVFVDFPPTHYFFWNTELHGPTFFLRAIFAARCRTEEMSPTLPTATNRTSGSGSLVFHVVDPATRKNETRPEIAQHSCSDAVKEAAFALIRRGAAALVRRSYSNDQLAALNPLRTRNATDPPDRTAERIPFNSSATEDNASVAPIHVVVYSREDASNSRRFLHPEALCAALRAGLRPPDKYAVTLVRSLTALNGTARYLLFKHTDVFFAPHGGYSPNVVFLPPRSIWFDIVMNENSYREWDFPLGTANGTQVVAVTDDKGLARKYKGVGSAKVSIRRTPSADNDPETVPCPQCRDDPFPCYCRRERKHRGNDDMEVTSLDPVIDMILRHNFTAS